MKLGITHYEAPPEDRLPGEMASFIKWFNSFNEKEKKLSPLIRASISHW